LSVPLISIPAASQGVWGLSRLLDEAKVDYRKGDSNHSDYQIEIEIGYAVKFRLIELHAEIEVRLCRGNVEIYVEANPINPCRFICVFYQKSIGDQM
jgi:hypothetical protein